MCVSDLYEPQQCGKLLRPCWQRCVKCACVALTILDELCNGSNIVALRFGHHGIRNVLGVVRWLKSLTLTLRNNVQQDLQTDATCIIRTMLCPFARGFKRCETKIRVLLRWRRQRERHFEKMNSRFSFQTLSRLF